MKTLKITIALVAVLLLTVSVVKSETITVTENNEIKQPNYETKSNFDLLATNKKKLDKPTNG